MKYRYLPFAASLAAYLVCETFAAELPETHEQGKNVGEGSAFARVGRAGSPAWKTFRESHHYLLTCPPPGWFPYVNEALMAKNPAMFLYSLMEMKNRFIKHIQHNRGNDPQKLTDDQAHVMRVILHAYNWLRALFPSVVDDKPAHPTTVERMIHCSNVFWKFFSEFYPTVLEENAVETSSALYTPDTRFGSSCFRSRRMQLRSIARCINKATDQLLYKWWSSKDLEIIFAALASVLHGSN